MELLKRGFLWSGGCCVGQGLYCISSLAYSSDTT